MRPNTEGAEEAVASATIGTAEQNALTVTVDLRTNSRSSVAPTTTSRLFRKSSKIRRHRSQRTQNEVMRLKNSQATEVATAFALSSSRTLKGHAGSRAGAEDTAQRMLEREVAVVAERSATRCSSPPIPVISRKSK